MFLFTEVGWHIHPQKSSYGNIISVATEFFFLLIYLRIEIAMEEVCSPQEKLYWILDFVDHIPLEYHVHPMNFSAKFSFCSNILLYICNPTGSRHDSF